MTTKEEMTLVEACASAAHETNRAYCVAIGDRSQPAWEDAPEWQRISCREGVAAALAGATPEESHENWMRLKLKEGWQYGPVKDPDRKQHPCMVPYGELPPEQRRKDTLYLTVVRAVAQALRQV